MPAVLADLSISSRWVLPMTARDALLENHTLVVRDGKILDLLPSAIAADRYAATVAMDRSEHLLMPGLVNAHTRIVPPRGLARSPQHVDDSALLGIAAMLKAGTTCFCGMGFFPEESARAAAAQGLRTLVGIPIAETASRWAASPGEYLTRALNFRDEFSGHPTITTAFAPLACAVGDATFGRVAMLANELDAGILISLHESRAEIDECVTRYGLRPIERLHALGLLTPALTAAHMVQVSEADLALAQRSGIAVTLSCESDLRSGLGAPPVAAWARTELRLGLGTGGDSSAAFDLWSELKLLALLSRIPEAGTPGWSAWDALAVATRGGASALGLESEIGTLETGKWADVCCVDLQTPALFGAGLSHSADPPGTETVANHMVFSGGRDAVTDVWVSGRHLLHQGAFTRLDWSELAARVARLPASMKGVRV